MPETAERLRTRAKALGVTVPPDAEARLVTYFDLLFRWNAKINLTSLTAPDAAIDRLLLEPLAAAEELPRNPDLIDLGSGGGSPAIPLALALEARRLVMVESKTRKAAFLAEAGPCDSVCFTAGEAGRGSSSRLRTTLVAGGWIRAASMSLVTSAT